MIAKTKSGMIEGLSVLGLAAVVYLATNNMPDGPAGFPRLIAAGLGICGALLFLRAALAGPKNQVAAGGPGVAPAFDWKLSFLVGAVWLALIFVARYFGFLIPGFLFIAGLAWFLLGRPRGMRSYMTILGFSGAMSIVLWLVFGVLLNVEPPGPMPF